MTRPSPDLDAERRELVAEGSQLFKRVVGDELNKLFPEARTLETFQQICVALAILQRKR